MTRMTGPDCAVMCNLIIYTYIHIPAYIFFFELLHVVGFFNYTSWGNGRKLN